MTADVEGAEGCGTCDAEPTGTGSPTEDNGVVEWDGNVYKSRCLNVVPGLENTHCDVVNCSFSCPISINGLTDHHK